jgi:hypothetical protein
MPWLKTCTWQGQFMGLSALTRFSFACSSSISVMNMFSRYLSQWPEASQSLRSTTCGVLISL